LPKQALDGYVTKPIHSQELKMAIDDIFPEPSDFPAGPGKGQDTTANPAPLAWDKARTLERLGGDEGLLQEVIEIFLTDAPKHIATLREAIRQSDAVSLEHAAHTLKGEVGYMGIATISSQARDLEEAGRGADFARAKILYASLEPKLTQLLATVRRAVEKKAKGKLVSGRPED
jgi:HPt (histidine-containing phosphotransfer) domain-containing protein